MDSTKTDLAVPYRILLALSDAADAKLITATLDSVKSVMSCKISTAVTFQEALTAQTREPHDVVVMDFHLPDAPGMTGLDRFRREAQGLPVIAYAKNPGECSPSLAAQRGAHDLLVRGGFDPYLLIRAVRYAAERRRSKDALRRHFDKLTRFQSVLFDLAKRGTADPDESLRRLCEGAAATLDVERVGVWLFNDDHTEIVCRQLHSRSRASEAPASVIRASDFPRYFTALEETRVVAAENAQRDPRTSEFSDPYLKPRGITSMMDAPIRLHGTLVGVVCHEHIGPPRDWPLEDQEFASSVADLAAITLEAQERRRVEETLREERNFTDAVLDSDRSPPGGARPGRPHHADQPGHRPSHRLRLPGRGRQALLGGVRGARGRRDDPGDRRDPALRGERQPARAFVGHAQRRASLHRLVHHPPRRQGRGAPPFGHHGHRHLPAQGPRGAAHPRRVPRLAHGAAQPRPLPRPPRHGPPADHPAPRPQVRPSSSSTWTASRSSTTASATWSATSS